MVVSDSASMEGTGMDSAAPTISRKQFGEGHVKVIGNEWRDNIFFAIWDNKEVMGACGIEIVLPSRARVNAWLRTSGTGGVLLGFSVYCFGFQRVSLDLLVQDYGHGRDRGRGTRWNIFDEGGYDWQGIGGIGSRGHGGCDRYAVMEMRGRNRKWFGTGNWRAVRIVRVNVVFQFSPRVH